jgi:hypothetical protein
MTLRGRWLAILGCFAGAAGPFACGGDAFEAGAGGDGGPTVEGSIPTDGRVGDGSGEGSLDGSPGDGASSPDGGETITGTVLDQYLVPMPGVGVHVEADMQHTTTASDGTFSLAGITTPYTVSIVATPAGGHRHGYVFQNVTRKTPTFQLTGETASLPRGTTLSGHVSANGTGVAGVVFADLPAGVPAAASNAIEVASGATSYMGPVGWYGPASVPATLYSLQWIVGSNGPVAYVAYTSQMETLSSGTPLTWDTPTSSTIMTTSSLEVTMGVSSAYSPTVLALYARPSGAQVAPPIAAVTSFSSTSTSFVTPNITGMTFVACGVQAPEGSDGGAGQPFGAACETGLAANSHLTLALPPATTLVSPPSSATLGTSFNFEPLVNGVYFVAFSPAGATAGAADSLYVITTDSQVKVPDLSNLGFAFPSGATYGVEVYGFAPFASIDAALSPTGFSSIATALDLEQGAAASGQVASSGAVSFQVQ